ncbi:Spore coat protein SA [Marinomonas gallaica]|uniref:Spore coat protein SA n=1 Tax=Marinomonas gallaica TaxID=1806667 RepID=A0A1C3JV23_9GAMM|nr:glycosyltransferase [Marinomonas gallaica]SBT18930.1 Spore coat protein SA [Marinomonas gallaica]SBT21885.1 Spore coat protein SA [Marinomonas gallaica]
MQQELFFEETQFPLFLKGKRVLFMHPNFPGQFRHLAPEVKKKGADVRAITFGSTPDMAVELNIAQAKPNRKPTEHVHVWLKDLDIKLIRAQAAEKTLKEWSDSGWQPDLIIGHAGWGDMMCARSIFPTAKIIGWFEFYYGETAGDLKFDPEFPPKPDAAFKGDLKNMLPLWMSQQVDAAVCATHFQKSVHPEILQSKLQVLHEGINTRYCCPNEDIAISLNDELKLTRKDKVITFINRNLEPYRGYHSFLRSLPAIFDKHPDAHVVIVGGDGVSYGQAPENGGSWKHIFLKEVAQKLDPKRVHFLGTVNYATLISLLQLTRAHVYLTYPFVLSWSLLEAMSCGAPVLGSSTAPVEEVITHNENGLLVDFFDYQAIAEGVDALLTMPESELSTLRENARQSIIQNYDLETVCLPNLMEFIQTVL